MWKHFQVRLTNRYSRSKLLRGCLEEVATIAAMLNAEDIWVVLNRYGSGETGGRGAGEGGRSQGEGNGKNDRAYEEKRLLMVSARVLLCGGR